MYVDSNSVFNWQTNMKKSDKKKSIELTRVLGIALTLGAWIMYYYVCLFLILSPKRLEGATAAVSSKDWRLL